MRHAIKKSSMTLLGLVVILGLFVVAGCSTPETETKTIYDVVTAQQHPTEDVMLMEVDETTRQVDERGMGSLVDFQRALYQCVRDGDDLRCHRTCGAEHECPESRNIIGADRSVSALGGMFRPSMMEADEPTEPAEDEVSEQDDGDDEAMSADDVEGE